MRDKLIAMTTLGCIFSLFFYYKVINPADDTSTLSKIDSSNPIVGFVNHIEEQDNPINLIDVPLSDSSEIEKSDNVNCELNVDETNKLSFSEAFKYYRNCNSVDLNFSWNGNMYSTLLKSEVENKTLITQDQDMIEIEESYVDKNHLKLQNQMIGDNLK